MNLCEGSLSKLDWEVQLIQMQKQYQIISLGGFVLDLTCVPGAWLQVAYQNLGPLEKGGVVVGIDTKRVKVPSVHCDSRVKTVCADVMTLPREQVRALSPKVEIATSEIKNHATESLVI